MWELNYINFFENLNKIANNSGYILGLYGSVLYSKHSAHDLDLVIFKYVDGANEKQLIGDIIDYFNGCLVEKYKGIFATNYIIQIIYNNNSELIDLSVRI